MDSPSLLDALDGVCRKAAEVAFKVRENMVRELKPDGSVVTNADKAVEEFLRKVLPDLLPNAGFWGEEFGFEEEGPGGLWVVDPIDGTTNFAFGNPGWGISVGLVKGDSIEAGAIYLPDLGEMYLTAKGAGARCNGKELPPIPAGPILPHEPVSYNDAVIRAYGIENVPFKLRCTGAVVIDAAYVARQRFRGFIGYRESLYDFAPAMLMGMELGADVRYADGDPIDVGALKRPVKMNRAWLIFPAETGFRLGSRV
jgi:myo-inositol-1(or 4)-monophosphatase